MAGLPRPAAQTSPARADQRHRGCREHRRAGGNPPEFAITLARSCDSASRDSPERLEVFAPRCLMFTKADLITGFSEFFQDADGNDATACGAHCPPFDPQRGNGAIERFERHFDELYQGLLGDERGADVDRPRHHHAARPARLSTRVRSAQAGPFRRAFVATLFEDNPFQFKPGLPRFLFHQRPAGGREPRSNAEARIEQRWPHRRRPAEHPRRLAPRLLSQGSVRARGLCGPQPGQAPDQSPQAAVATGGLCAVDGLLGTALAADLVHLGNRQLLANVGRPRQGGGPAARGATTCSRVSRRWRSCRTDSSSSNDWARAPAGSRSLAYQASASRPGVTRVFSGIEIVLLEPVSPPEAFLEEVNRSPEALSAQDAGAAQRPAPRSRPCPYREASPRRVDDAYNALKTYPHAGCPEHAELGHLNDQLTRFWRGWLDDNRRHHAARARSRLAGRLLSFHLSHAADADWPRIRPNLAIEIDLTRQNLRKVVRGMPAQERVYAQIKARASTRFAPVTVASIVGKDGAGLVSGSQAVSGAFTLRAWREHVEPQIRRAANESLQSADWVLDISSRDDLSLEGSPEQIRKQLVASYKTDYANAWKGFTQGNRHHPFENFDDAVERINTLGDPQRSRLWRCFAASTNRPPGTAPASSMPGWSAAGKASSSGSSARS